MIQFLDVLWNLATMAAVVIGVPEIVYAASLMNELIIGPVD